MCVWVLYIFISTVFQIENFVFPTITPIVFDLTGNKQIVTPALCTRQCFLLYSASRHILVKSENVIYEKQQERVCNKLPLYSVLC